MSNMGWIIAFWVSSMVLFYVYFGYPVLILFLSKLLPTHFMKFSEDELKDSSLLPTISVFIPAYNEEQV